ncbi:uncharacterized Zn finger protein (UPF0148 family) [Bacillus luteolus]|nr:uncharacterized Zn finger protein (UPF0148 family) [Cytobacillus luteolus]
MYKKVCNRCFKPSFSSCNTGEWLCPICQKDITHIKARQSMEPKPILSVVKMQKDNYTEQPTFSKYI